MSAGMRALAPKTWPPLVMGAAVPRWVIWRDRAVTLLAWLLLALLCRNFLLLVADEVRVVAGQDRLGPAFDPLALWQRLRGYVLTIAALLAALTIAGLRTIARLRAQPGMPDPPPLPAAEEAAAQGTTPETLEAWRARRIAVVHVDEAGRMRVE